MHRTCVRIRCTGRPLTQMVSEVSQSGGIATASSPTRDHFSAVRIVQGSAFYAGAGSNRALIQATRINHFLPPPIARAVAAFAMVGAQAFWMAYQREVKKLQNEESRSGTDGDCAAEGGTSSRTDPLSPAEALRILGLDLVDNCVVTDSIQISLPLTNPSDREIARNNFQSMFSVAIKQNNMFLAGKLSAAYRMCVDPAWDITPTDEDTTSRTKE